MGEEDWMKKVVFFTDFKKFKDALGFFNIESFSGKSVPVKLHMGESKNKYYPKFDFVKQLIDVLIDLDIKPYLFDTTVAYSGLRNTKSGYYKLAKTHGFTLENVGCKVVIDDTGKSINVEGRKFEVANHLLETSLMFALSHVKGHVATGMGGAIKNIGMGGVTKETKRKMHHACRPAFEKDKCTFCGVCSEVCPFSAINIKDLSWKMNMQSCFGCGVCVDNCESNAISYEDANLQYLLACAALACLRDKNVIYLNDVNRISKSCDCDPFAGPIICPDIGYLVFLFKNIFFQVIYKI